MTIAHIYNGELGFDVRTKLNALIDQVAAIPTGGGTGDVVGPASAIADSVAVYNGVTGKLIKDGGATIANIIASAVAASGTGDVVGPASAVADRIAVYNGVTGKLIKDGGQTIAQVIAAAGGGGGGTTILDGSGVPSTGLGSVGDYYVDETGNTMYGPKAISTPYGPDQNAIPSTTLPGAVAGGANYELGVTLVIAVAGQITAIRYYREPSANTAHTVNVWSTGGTLLASASTANDGGGTGWKQVALSAPLTVAAGTVVISSNFVGDFARTFSASFPISNGGDVSLTGAVLAFATGLFPSSPDTSNFFVDVVFQKYQGVAPYWPVAVSGPAIGGAIASATAGSVLFAGPAGVMAQDHANFWWDDALNDLHIGNRYFVGTTPALYRVSNVSGDNWFEGNSGNPATTGAANFATGDEALSLVTTGSTNLGIGTGALKFLTTGTGNSAIGYNAGFSITTGGTNFAIGGGSVNHLTSGSSNAGIGNGALQNLVTGTYNVGVGSTALASLNGAETGNTAIGTFSGQGLIGSTFCTLVGYSTGQATTSGDANCFIGAYAGWNVTGGNYNTLLGSWPGPSASMTNVIALSTGGGVANGVLKADCGYSNAGWTFAGSPKAGAPANTDMPSGFFSVIDDTSANKTWLSFNKAGTIRQTEIGGGGGGGGMAIGGAITSATAGSVLFAGAAGVLAQDNANFYWDATTFTLKLGYAANPAPASYWLNGVPALFEVRNVAGNNWFEGNAGNTALSGNGNFGTGDQVLSSLTSGSYNVGLGGVGVYAKATLQSATSATSNMAIGAGALGFMTTGLENTAIGSAALGLLGNGGTTGSYNVALGLYALKSLGNVIGGGSQNVGVGANSAGSLSAGDGNTFIGFHTFGSITSGIWNTAVGSDVFDSASGDNNFNLILGRFKGPTMANVNDVIVLCGGRDNANNNNTALDCNWTTPSRCTWSFNTRFGNVPASLHVYGTNDNSTTPPTNYERGIFDWNVAANVLTIGTQAGGTGTLRPVNIIGSALTFNGSPIGGGGSMAIGGAITSATSGSVLFADASGNLAQDNTNFKWDDPNNILTIGTGLNFGTSRALYRLPNAGGDNWFAGGSGNLTLSGYLNFGFGDGAMASLTTGAYNTASGALALNSLSSGSFNFAFGLVALRALTTGVGNVAMGYDAVSHLTTGSYNMGIGTSALTSLTGNDQKNLAIGSLCGQNLNGAENNTMIGYNAGGGFVAAYYNTIIGQFAGANVSGGFNNTLIGCWRGPSASMSNVIALSLGDNGSGVSPPLLDYNYTTAGRWTAASDFALAAGFGFVAISKAGAPAASDLSSGTFAVVDDTSAGQTWLVFNKAGTIRKVQLT